MDKNLEQNGEYQDILITDFQLHVVKPRKPTPWYRVVLKAIRSKKKQRAYTTDLRKDAQGNPLIVYSLPPEIQKQMAEAERTGKKIRFILPKGGAPVYMGKDLIEYLKARQREVFDKKKWWKGLL